MANPVEPLGLTLNLQDGQSPIPVFQDEGGLETFETNEPYLLEDGRSLVDPIPVVVASRPVWQDVAGNPFNALGVKVLPQGENPPDPTPEHTLGPQDIVIEDAGLTSMGGSFDLASPSMTLGVVCYYTGVLNAGEIQATHGGEPLTLVRLDRNASGVFTAIFYGNGLTIEEAELRVFTTSESAKLGPALMRMRDDLGYENGITPIWNDGLVTYSYKTREITTQCTPSGAVMTAFGVRSYKEGATIQQAGSFPAMVIGLSSRVLHGDLEELDNDTFASDYWEQDVPGVFTLTDAGPDREMTLDVQIDANVETGLRFDYTSPTDGISVFYMRPNGTFVNMSANSGVDRRWYLPIPPSTSGYVRLRFRASNTASIRDIRLIRDPFGISGCLTMASGDRVADGWKLYGMTLNQSPLSISSFAVDGV